MTRERGCPGISFIGQPLSAGIHPGRVHPGCSPPNLLRSLGDGGPGVGLKEGIDVRGFGELEAAIMSALWNRAEPATVREVWYDLRPERDLAYNTVLTVVDNLYKKGWLHRDRHGRAFRYRPLASRADYGGRLMRDAMAESGDPTGSLVGFVRQLSDDESAALREALSAYESGGQDS